MAGITCALQLWSIKKRGVRDDILKYTWTNLKIVRLCIARTHGWVELGPTVPTSSSHRSSTVTTFRMSITSSVLTFEEGDNLLALIMKENHDLTAFKKCPSLVLY